MASNTPNFELPFTNYGQEGGNGRVNFSAKSSAGGSAPDSFSGYGYQKTVDKDFEMDMIRGNMESNPVSSAYFSAKNIEVIQNGIRKNVFEKSQPKGYIIDNQSVDELKIIMRALYYTYSRNLPFDVQGQVNELNERVYAWSVPHILSAVDHYNYYIQDISHLPVPMAQPVNISRAGTRTLPQSLPM